MRENLFEQISGAPNILVVQKCCFAGCRLLGGQGDGLPGMGVPKLAVAPHKLLTQPHKHGSYRIIKYQTIPDQEIRSGCFESDEHGSYCIIKYQTIPDQNGP